MTANSDVDSGALPDSTLQTLRDYRDLLLAWNRRFNLTAITDPADVDRKLIGDALAMLPALDDAIAAWHAESRRSSTPHAEGARPRLIDIGSGAGLPGLILKIARPDLDVTLVEATGKKVGFLEHAILDLGLRECVALHGRSEEIAHQPHHRERYDIATARAVASLPALMELAAPFLRIGGHAIFPKGSDIAKELQEGVAAGRLVGARIVSSEPLTQQSADSVTRLVIAVKIESTPTRYPRRSGIPAKEPLGRTGQ